MATCKKCMIKDVDLHTRLSTAGIYFSPALCGRVPAAHELTMNVGEVSCPECIEKLSELGISLSGDALDNIRDLFRELISDNDPSLRSEQGVADVIAWYCSGDVVFSDIDGLFITRLGQIEQLIDVDGIALRVLSLIRRSVEGGSANSINHGICDDDLVDPSVEVDDDDAPLYSEE